MPYKKYFKHLYFIVLSIFTSIVLLSFKIKSFNPISFAIGISMFNILLLEYSYLHFQLSKIKSKDEYLEYDYSKLFIDIFFVNFFFFFLITPTIDSDHFRKLTYSAFLSLLIPTILSTSYYKQNFKLFFICILISILLIVSRIYIEPIFFEILKYLL